MAAIVYIKKFRCESVEKRNIYLTITQIRSHVSFGNNLREAKAKKGKILFCYTEMA